MLCSTRSRCGWFVLWVDGWVIRYIRTNRKTKGTTWVSRSWNTQSLSSGLWEWYSRHGSNRGHLCRRYSGLHPIGVSTHPRDDQELPYRPKARFKEFRLHILLEHPGDAPTYHFCFGIEPGSGFKMVLLCAVIPDWLVQFSPHVHGWGKVVAWREHDRISSRFWYLEAQIDAWFPFQGDPRVHVHFRRIQSC